MCREFRAAVGGVARARAAGAREVGTNCAWRAAPPEWPRAGKRRVVRRIGLCAALGALWILGGCGGGVSGGIGRACMAGGRDAANPQICSCIQGVANQTLSSADQRRVAGFFTDPDEAQEARVSDTPRDEAFWERYRAFTSQAEAACG